MVPTSSTEIEGICVRVRVRVRAYVCVSRERGEANHICIGSVQSRRGSLLWHKLVVTSVHCSCTFIILPAALVATSVCM